MGWIFEVVSSLVVCKMRISLHSGIENYSWKVDIKKSLLILLIFCLWFSVPSCLVTFRPKCVYTLRPRCVDSTKIHIMGILRHFGTENYAWRHGIVQNLCRYYWFFLCDFLGPRCLNITTSHTTDCYSKLELGKLWIRLGCSSEYNDILSTI